MWTVEELMDYLSKNFNFRERQNTITYEQLSNILRDIHILNQFYVCNGATKIAFVSRTEPIVYKCNYWNEDEDEDVEDFSEEEREIYENHYGVLNYDVHTDYCKEEFINSTYFIENGFRKNIAKVEYCGTINGTNISIYSQEKAEIFMDHGSNEATSDESKSAANSIVSDCYAGELPIEWIADLVEYSGEEEARLLLEFIEENGINDLHDGNVGYIGNRVVLIDYSGYYE